MDILTKQKRSWNMSRIRSKNTKPELLVRSLLHMAGYRFRLHVKTLPGKPDIVLPKYRTVIFVHGCFWHRHKGCKFAYNSKSRVEFWKSKFKQNVANQKKAENLLKKSGWKIMVIWECEIANLEKLSKFLNVLDQNRKAK